MVDVIPGPILLAKGHPVRFYTRFAANVQRKKAKIMRKVKYPLQFDAIDLVSKHARQVLNLQATDELRARLQPINTEVKQIMKARDERAVHAKRQNSDISGEEGRLLEEKDKIMKMALSRGVGESGTNPSGMYELCGR